MCVWAWNWLKYYIRWNYLAQRQRCATLTLNSCSRKLSRLNSHDSSNAVNIGSFDDSEIRLGLANARYAFIRERECLSESSRREMTHSSQPHLVSWCRDAKKRKPNCPKFVFAIQNETGSFPRGKPIISNQLKSIRKGAFIDSMET